ncbi:hypothetical protein GW17_00009827, partial [Ensete ventricosum]
LGPLEQMAKKVIGSPLPLVLSFGIVFVLLVIDHVVYVFDTDLHIDSESRPGMLSLFQEDQENPMQTPGYVHRARIQSIAYDEKNGTVTLSGPFDPDCLSKKLCCMAYKVIKDIQIKPEDDPPPPPPSQNQPDPPPTPQPDAPATAQDPEPPGLVYLPVFPACFCRCSCSEAHHGCCCSCGKMRSDPPPVYGGPYCQEVLLSLNLGIALPGVVLDRPSIHPHSPSI